MTVQPRTFGAVGVLQQFDLTGKVAVVTGGSRGLGRAMALGFAEVGADVVIASRKLDNCEAVADDVRIRFGRRALAVSFHQGHWEDCDRLVDTVYDHFGTIDVLVNNAGLSPLYPDLPSVTEELYDKVLAVNLKGPFRLSSLVGTRMAAGDGGCIINIGTIGAVRPNKFSLPYACAKAGLNALTVGLADAFAPKVRANCIMPGNFLPPSYSIPREFTGRAGEGPPSPHADPEQIVGTAIYLASDASSFTNGTLIRVDGGQFRQT